MENATKQQQLFVWQTIALITIIINETDINFGSELSELWAISIECCIQNILNELGARSIATDVYGEPQQKPMR